MAEGGQFIHYYKIMRDRENHPFLHSNLTYEVKIGDEWRHVFVYSSLHAVKVE